MVVTLLTDKIFTALKKKIFSHTIWQAVINARDGRARRISHITSTHIGNQKGLENKIGKKMLQFAFCFTFYLLRSLKAAENELDGSGGLKRGVHVQGNRVSYGNFAVDKFHRLQVSVGSSSVVSNYRECALNCVNNPPCSSINVASSPRSDGKYRCELLNEDKYSANPGKLVSSQKFHHYSIKVF